MSAVRVPLTNGGFMLVDEEDLPLVTGVNWGRSPQGYARGWQSGEGREVLAHRFLLGLGAGDRRKVDHVNGDRLDNRRSNLRLATTSQNGANTGLRSDNSSGYRGVCWDTRRQTWMAYIKRDGRQRHLGYFDTAEAAALAYNDAAIAQWGEYARLNEVPDAGEAA